MTNDDVARQIGAMSIAPVRPFASAEIVATEIASASVPTRTPATVVWTVSTWMRARPVLRYDTVMQGKEGKQ